MIKRDVFIVSAVRTAIGSFGGGLSAVPAAQLGGIVIKDAVRQSGVSPEDVDEVYMGQVLTGGIGQAPARQAGLGGGLPHSVPCTTIGKVCGSGLQAAILAARGTMLGETNVTVAGGMENMSATAYALTKARDGYRLGNGDLVDMMVNDGLWDVYNNLHMGTCADIIAAEENVSREAQDDFAVTSYTRSREATEKGLYRPEIVPVVIPQKKGDPKIFDVDESPQVFNEQKMRALSPVFNKIGGTITAGNASPINDGASAVVLASEEAVNKHHLKPLARIVSWGFGAMDPRQFTLAPVIAVNNALKAAGLGAQDIDIWEINEAFAMAVLLVMREFNLDLNKVNPLGGAIALGHPIGASGARILTTLLNGLQLRQGRYGLATLCIGGGEGNALIVERV